MDIKVDASFIIPFTSNNLLTQLSIEYQAPRSLYICRIETT